MIPDFWPLHDSSRLLRHGTWSKRERDPAKRNLGPIGLFQADNQMVCFDIMHGGPSSYLTRLDLEI
jgi:hypothetical protein